jgi:hypothetical protein
MPCQCELIIGDKTCEDRLSRLFEGLARVHIGDGF